jgi:copper chaperone CopZ
MPTMKEIKGTLRRLLNAEGMECETCREEIQNFLSDVKEAVGGKTVTFTVHVDSHFTYRENVKTHEENLNAGKLPERTETAAPKVAKPKVPSKKNTS